MISQIGTAMIAEIGKLKAERELMRDMLIDVEAVLSASRIWDGMEWVYHPIHPMRYKVLLNNVRTTMDIIDEDLHKI